MTVLIYVLNVHLYNTKSKMYGMSAGTMNVFALIFLCFYILKYKMYMYGLSEMSLTSLVLLSYVIIFLSIKCSTGCLRRHMNALGLRREGLTLSLFHYYPYIVF